MSEGVNDCVPRYTKRAVFGNIFDRLLLKVF